jgi:hypothetical protein
MNNEEEVEIVEEVSVSPIDPAVEEQEVVDSTVVPEAAAEVVEEEVVPVQVVKSKKVEHADVVQAFAQASWVGQVPDITDEVHVSSMVFESNSRNSLSVAQLQIRLGVMGYSDSSTDPLGWFSEGTRKALRDFQTFAGLPVTGNADERTLEAVFTGTSVKVVE